jgi:lipopolysaccharide biosynthesis protein
MFYDEQAASFRTYLSNLPQGADLFISTDTEEKKARIETAFAGFERGAVSVRVTPNRGRDIAPKLVGFRDVYDRYEFVLHLHSKASKHDVNLSIWRFYLMESLVGSPEIVQSCLWSFQHEASLGMIFPQHFDYVRRWIDWGLNFGPSQALAQRLGFDLRMDRALDFPSGSMFWARSAALKPLLDLNLSFEEFPDESGQTDYTLAHAVERLYAMVVERAGYRWMKIAKPDVMVEHTGVTPIDSVPAFERFVSENTVSITGSDPIPVAQVPFVYNGETPAALRKAAGTV